MTYNTSPKRSIRETNAGNIQGYVGGRSYRYIGDTYCEQSQKFAKAWVAGEVDIDAGVWDAII